MHPAAIDHLVVTAPTLEVGARYIERMLGVLPEPGGAHARMGTHNLLLKTGGSSYLEVIAENPAAPAPRRPRWFDLDTLEAGAAPRLATWVLRTDDIRALCDRAPVSLGTIVAMSRGDLEWFIAVPDDGGLILEGLCPYVIQWSSDGHPASRLPDRGVQLLRLEAVHPEPERIAVLWKALGGRGQPHPLAWQSPSSDGAIRHPGGRAGVLGFRLTSHVYDLATVSVAGPEPSTLE